MRQAVFSGVLIAAVLSATVRAEDAVLVTATRFADSKRNLPIGVTVITAEDIRSSATSNLAEMLAQFGLLHIRDNTGTPNPQLDLRGFGITGDQNTLVLVDGVRISENELAAAQLTSIPIESIERIEILRGSGAVLYGGGATGGTINVITRAARAGETNGHVLGRAGGYGTQEWRAGYARQGESFGANVAFSDEDTKGYRRNNRYQQTNVAAAFDARLGAGRAWLRLGFDDQGLRLPGALTEAQMQTDRRQTLTPNDYSARHGGYAVLGGAWNAGRHEFSADVALREKHAVAFFAAFGGFFTDTRVKQWSFAPRAKLAFDALGREHSLVIGADLRDWSYETRSAASPAGIGSPFSRRLGEQTTSALYAQANLWVAGATRVVAGGRVERIEDRLTEEVFPPDERRRARALEAWELALRQGFGAGWSGYAKYGKSYRLANFDENACFFPPCASSLLEPQTAHGAELGVEYERNGWRARASLHEMRLRNEIYFSPLVFANLNLSPTRRRGLELEAAVRATRELELRGALALMEARFRSGVYGGVDVTGREVPLVPEAIATAGATWKFAARSLASLNLRHVGKQRFDNDQANLSARRQPAYAIADLKIEHRIERIALALEARNLFDRKYFSYGAWNFGTSFSALPAPGRALYVSVAYRLE